MNSKQKRKKKRKNKIIYAIVNICMAHARMVGCHVNADWYRISLAETDDGHRYPYLIFDGTLEKWINIGISDELLVLQDNLNKLYRKHRDEIRSCY